ncbi:MAG: hypothetical protein KGH57_00140 [Candidatus Micrarchaeota archaeon]|nr:hypothetical protein [Candidatus Micrarchaeota archaeon]
MGAAANNTLLIFILAVSLFSISSYAQSTLVGCNNVCGVACPASGYSTASCSSSYAYTCTSSSCATTCNLCVQITTQYQQNTNYQFQSFSTTPIPSTLSPAESVNQYNIGNSGWFLTCPEPLAPMLGDVSPGDNSLFYPYTADHQFQWIGGDACRASTTPLTSTVDLPVSVGWTVGPNGQFASASVGTLSVSPVGSLALTNLAYSPELDTGGATIASSFNVNSYVFQSIPAAAQNDIWTWSAPFANLNAGTSIGDSQTVTASPVAKFTEYTNPTTDDDTGGVLAGADNSIQKNSNLTLAGTSNSTKNTTASKNSTALLLSDTGKAAAQLSLTGLGGQCAVGDTFCLPACDSGLTCKGSGTRGETGAPNCDLCNLPSSGCHQFGTCVSVATSTTSTTTSTSSTTTSPTTSVEPYVCQYSYAYTEKTTLTSIKNEQIPFNEVNVMTDPNNPGANKYTFNTFQTPILPYITLGYNMPALDGQQMSNSYDVFSPWNYNTPINSIEMLPIDTPSVFFVNYSGQLSSVPAGSLLNPGSLKNLLSNLDKLLGNLGNLLGSGVSQKSQASTDLSQFGLYQPNIYDPISIAQVSNDYIFVLNYSNPSNGGNGDYYISVFRLIPRGYFSTSGPDAYARSKGLYNLQQSCDPTQSGCSQSSLEGANLQNWNNNWNGYWANVIEAQNSSVYLIRSIDLGSPTSSSTSTFIGEYLSTASSSTSCSSGNKCSGIDYFSPINITADSQGDVFITGDLANYNHKVSKIFGDYDWAGIMKIPAVNGQTQPSPSQISSTTGDWSSTSGVPVLTEIAVSSDGTWLYASNENIGTVYQFSARNKQLEENQGLDLTFATGFGATTQSSQAGALQTSLNIAYYLQYGGLYGYKFDGSSGSLNLAASTVNPNNVEVGTDMDSNAFHHAVGLENINGYIYVLDDWKGRIGFSTSSGVGWCWTFWSCPSQNGGTYFDILVLRVLDPAGNNVPINPTLFNDMFTTQSCAATYTPPAPTGGGQSYGPSSCIPESSSSQPPTITCSSTGGVVCNPTYAGCTTPSGGNGEREYCSAVGSSSVSAGESQYYALSTGTYFASQSQVYPPYGWVLSANITATSNGASQVYSWTNTNAGAPHGAGVGMSCAAQTSIYCMTLTGTYVLTSSGSAYSWTNTNAGAVPGGAVRMSCVSYSSTVFCVTPAGTYTLSTSPRYSWKNINSGPIPGGAGGISCMASPLFCATSSGTYELTKTCSGLTCQTYTYSWTDSQAGIVPGFSTGVSCVSNFCMTTRGTYQLTISGGFGSSYSWTDSGAGVVPGAGTSMSCAASSNTYCMTPTGTYYLSTSYASLVPTYSWTDTGAGSVPDTAPGMSCAATSSPYCMTLTSTYVLSVSSGVGTFPLSTTFCSADNKDCMFNPTNLPTEPWYTSTWKPVGPALNAQYDSLAQTGFSESLNSTLTVLFKQSKSCNGFWCGTFIGGTTVSDPIYDELLTSTFGVENYTKLFDGAQPFSCFTNSQGHAVPDPTKGCVYLNDSPAGGADYIDNMYPPVFTTTNPLRYLESLGATQLITQPGQGIGAVTGNQGCTGATSGSGCITAYIKGTPQLMINMYPGNWGVPDTISVQTTGSEAPTDSMQLQISGGGLGTPITVTSPGSASYTVCSSLSETVCKLGGGHTYTIKATDTTTKDTYTESNFQINDIPLVTLQGPQSVIVTCTNGQSSCTPATGLVTETTMTITATLPPDMQNDQVSIGIACTSGNCQTTGVSCATNYASMLYPQNTLIESNLCASDSGTATYQVTATDTANGVQGYATFQVVQSGGTPPTPGAAESLTSSLSGYIIIPYEYTYQINQNWNIQPGVVVKTFDGDESYCPPQSQGPTSSMVNVFSYSLVNGQSNQISAAVEGGGAYLNDVSNNGYYIANLTNAHLVLPPQIQYNVQNDRLFGTIWANATYCSGSTSSGYDCSADNQVILNATVQLQYSVEQHNEYPGICSSQGCVTYGGYETFGTAPTGLPYGTPSASLIAPTSQQAREYPPRGTLGSSSATSADGNVQISITQEPITIQNSDLVTAAARNGDSVELLLNGVQVGTTSYVVNPAGCASTSTCLGAGTYPFEALDTVTGESVSINLIILPQQIGFKFNPTQKFFSVPLFDLYKEVTYDSPLGLYLNGTQYCIGPNCIGQYPLRGYQQIVYVMNDRFNNLIYVPVEADIADPIQIKLSITQQPDANNPNLTSITINGVAGSYSNIGSIFTPLPQGQDIYLYYNNNLNYVSYNPLAGGSQTLDAEYCAFGTQGEVASLSCVQSDPVYTGTSTSPSRTQNADVVTYAPEYNSIGQCNPPTQGLLEPQNFMCNVYGYPEGAGLQNSCPSTGALSKCDAAYPSVAQCLSTGWTQPTTGIIQDPQSYCSQTMPADYSAYLSCAASQTSGSPQFCEQTDYTTGNGICSSQIGLIPYSTQLANGQWQAQNTGAVPISDGNGDFSTQLYACGSRTDSVIAKYYGWPPPEPIQVTQVPLAFTANAVNGKGGCTGTCSSFVSTERSGGGQNEFNYIYAPYTTSQSVQIGLFELGYGSLNLIATAATIATALILMFRHELFAGRRGRK